MAILRPSLEHCAQLRPPLNGGELRVLEHLERLSDEWTVWVQPRLGQDVPDFVAVHDLHGVCAIEVKDWAYGEYRQIDDGTIEHLSDGQWCATTLRPRYQAYRYRSTIFDRFFAMPEDGSTPTNAVRSVVVFPDHTTEQAVRLLSHHLVTLAEHAVDVFGGDDLERSIEHIVRAHTCTPPQERSVERLRRHLAESEVVTDRRLLSPLSYAANNIADNPRKAKIRRVKGTAGCGKSFGLAARAARLAAEGKSVLVLSFNITLAHYLRTLVTARCRESGADPTLVTTTNFHSFCARVVEDAELAGFHIVDPVNVPGYEKNVAKAFQAFGCGFQRKFDAVLVDEGQDFTLGWWNMLRNHVVVDGGEMLLVADPTQDVYDRRSWTDEDKMLGAGFSGKWTELHGSYRLPSDLVPMVNHFAAHHLDGEHIAGAVPNDRVEVAGASGATQRRWMNLDPPNELGRAIGTEVVRLLAEHRELSPDDVVFLCETHRDGIEAAHVIQDAGHHVHHVFSNCQEDRQRRRRRFWPDAPGVKGCTVHSFKGWEARALVMGIGTDPGSRRLAYVGMTRVKSDSAGGQSFLSVVNSDLTIAAFQSTFEELATAVAATRVG